MDGFGNKTKQAADQCGVLGMDLLDNRPSILREVIHQTRLKSIIMSSQSYKTFRLKISEFPKNLENCTNFRKFSKNILQLSK